MTDINNEPRDVRSLMTFGHYVERRFLPARRDPQLRPVRPGTVNNQAQRLKAYILPVIGSVCFRELEQEHLREVLRQARGREDLLGQEMLRKIRVDLMHVCRMASSEGYLDREIWHKLPLPESRKLPTEKRSVTLQQYLEATRPLSERDRLAFDLVAFVGLRPSEVFALKVGDIRQESIRIQRSLYAGAVNPTKTTDSRRHIGVPATILERLGAHVRSLPANDADAWLFPSARVLTPEWPDNAMDNRIRPQLERVGYRWLTWAILRRTFSTLHRAAGTSLDMIAYQQGHTKSTHLDHYVQYAPAMLRPQLDAVYGKFLELLRPNRAN